MADLKPGFEQDGYRFNGGDPANPRSWHPVDLSIGTVNSGFKYLGGNPGEQSNWQKAPERSYIGAAAESGGRTLLAAGARVIEDLNPFTTSDADLAVLFKDKPEELKKFQEDSVVSVLSRFANEQTKRAREVMQQVNPNEKGAISDKPLSQLEYATLDPEKAAYLSPTRVAGDVLQSLPTTLALAVTGYLTRGRSLVAAQEAETAALASGASQEAAKAAAREAAVKTGAETMAKVGAASEGTAGYAVQKNQSIDEVMGMKQDKLEQAPAFRELIDQGYSPEAAKVVLANQVGTDAGITAGVVDAATNLVGGHFLGKIIGEGGSLGARVAKGALNESATEFVQSAGEQAGANAAARLVDPSRSLSEGVLESAVAGGVVGGVTGGATAGAFGSKQRDIEHDAALQDIANSQNAGQAAAGANALAGNLDNIIRQELTPATDQLLGVPASPIQQATTVDQAIANAESQSGVGLLAQQMAVQRQLDQQSGIPSEQRASSELPVVGAPAQTEPGTPLSLPAMQSNLDRRSELLGQADKAGLEAERQSALAQEQVVAEGMPAGRQQGVYADLTPMNQLQARQRLAVLRDENPGTIFAATAHPSVQGKFAIREVQAPTAELNVAPTAPMTGTDQNKLEGAAMVGAEQNRRAEDTPRQRMISRAMANIEARGGVASPMEAEILREANMGQPYDRIDPALGRQADTDQKLTAATGVAVGNEAGQGFGAREAGGELNRVSKLEQQNNESMTEQERRAAAEREQKSRELDQDIEATSQPAAAPAVDDVIAAMKVAPALRTAEQKITIDQAKSRMSTEDFAILQRQAQNPAAMSATDKLRMDQLRNPTTPLSEPSAGTIIQSDATFSTNREPVLGVTETVSDGDTQHQIKVVNGSKLAGMDGLLRQLARTFGKRVVFFNSDTLKADGFVRNGDSRSIYINANSQMSPLAVFGHELMHLLKRDNPVAYKAVATVIASRMDSETRTRFRADYGSGANLEELSSDLLGNAFSDENFLTQVFEEIAQTAPEGQARNIIARFAAALNKSIKAALAVIQSGAYAGKQFRADEMVKNLEDIRAALKSALKTYAQQQQEPAMALEAEQAKAEASIKLEDNATATAPVNRAREAARAARTQMGETVTASTQRTPDSWKATAAEKNDAKAYEQDNGILPYTSEGQLSPAVETDRAKFSVKREGKYGNHPLFDIPVNKNGTVTLYYPATNEAARALARDRKLRGATPTSNRIYLTNESSGPKVMNNPGNIEQSMDGANVLIQVDPALLQLDMEHSDGRKDFFIQIAEGEAFAKKMAQTKLFTLDAPRTKALSQDVKLTDIERSITDSVNAYLALDSKGRRERLRQARETLKREHNVGTLLGENGKLEKTRVGDYGLTYDGKSVASLGLGLASAQKINEKNLSTCPKSAICEGLCLGETSGQNLLYGGEGQFKSGPRLSQYLKTEALVLHPEDFAIVLHNEIERFTKKASREDFQVAIRLNVTSDFRPQTFESLINTFSDVMFYDYTKLPTRSIAPNHHLTYSSTGASQVVNGKTVINPESNWDKMVDRLNEGLNVAMAFTSRTDMPSFVEDEATGQRFQVWDGDNYDARFLDPKREDGVGMIVGLTNKDRTTKPEDAAEKHKGFFLDYDRARDGDTLVIKDQKQLANSGRKTIPIGVEKSPVDTRVGAQLSPSRDFARDDWFREHEGIAGQTRNPIVDTAAFKRWFKNSKIVDESGDPLVVYHTGVFDSDELVSGAELNRRNVNYGGVAGFNSGNNGIYFSASPGYSAVYGMNREGATMYPVYLSMQNPLYVRSQEQISRLEKLKKVVRDWIEERDIKKKKSRGDWSVLDELKRNESPYTRSMYITDEYMQELKDKGYDGIVNLVHNEIVAFDPKQIKSATGNNGEFNPETSNITKSAQRPFYSQLERAIEQVPERLATQPAQQWKAWLASNAAKLGVKKDEINWSGINDYLDLRGKDKVTKDEIADYLSQNGVQIKETMLGSDDETGATVYRSRLEEMDDEELADEADESNVEYDSINSSNRERIIDDIIRSYREDNGRTLSAEVGQTKYRQYTLPGGENYRELLLTLPDRGTTEQAEEFSRQMYEKYGTPMFRDKMTPEERATFDDLNNTVQPYQSAHWNEKNILAHIRFNDRTDADGNKVLFIEELQSDWAQEGRKKGFTNRESVEDQLLRHGWTIEQDGYGIWVVRDRDGDAMGDGPTRELALERSGAPQSSIPSAPFVTDTKAWLSLAIKRMIAYAAENGYDKVAFVNGEQSADRYDLSKQIDYIEYEQTEPGKYYIRAVDYNGNRPLTEYQQTPEQIENLVGKEIAQKIVDGVGEKGEDGNKVLRTKDLKVGGEGMISFYNKIVPQVVNDVLKKLGGGKVETVNIGDKYVVDDGEGYRREYDTLEQATADQRREGNDLRAIKAPMSQLGFTVTPEMREQAMAGQPLFSRQRIVGESSRQYTPEQKAMFENVGRTVDVPTFKERLQELRKDMGKKLAQGLADQFAPLRSLDPKAYALARLSKGAAGAFEAMLHHGKLAIKDNVYDADMSGGFIDRVGVPLHGELEDFLWWVASNRAERLAAEDRENLFTADDIAAGKSLDNGTTNYDYTLQHGPNKGKITRDRTLIYRDSLKTFDEFNRNAMDMAEQSGLIDGASRQYWENEFYVPFYRVSDEDGAFVGAKMSSALVRQRAFKQLKGGTDKLNSDLLANMLQNWSHLIDAAAKNRAAMASLQAAEKMGVAVEADNATVKSMGKSIGKKSNVVWYMDQGVERHYLVDDPYVLTAITSLEYAGMRGPLMDAMSAFKKWLTIGVTASPAFKVRNLIRDSIQAIGTSDLSYNPITNVREGIKASARDSQTYVSALASGGLIRFGTMLEGKQSDRVRQLVKSGVKDSTILDSDSKVQAMYDKYLEPAITAYNELGNRGEEINRAALFAQLQAQGVDQAQAALLARDLMDFSMQGSWTGVRFLTQVVPFMNARVQGLYKLGRAANEDPRKFATVLGATAMFSIALMLAYSDDKDWKKREDWDRDNFWWFKIGGVAFRIPKPFEIGAIATLAERGVEYFATPEMTGKRFMQRFKAILADNLSLNPVPQLVKPIVDIYSNKDSFSGRPIETMGMERLKAQYRYTQNTSMAARALSTGTFGALSPVQYDHLIKGYFGWLGSFVVAGSDMAIRPMTNEATRPQADYWKMATAGFVQELPAAQSRYVSQMYDEAKELEEAYGTWRSLLKQGRTAEAAEFRRENRDALNRYPRVENVKQNEAKFNERIRMIERSAMDPAVKKEKIAAIQAQKDRMAQTLAPR